MHCYSSSSAPFHVTVYNVPTMSTSSSHLQNRLLPFQVFDSGASYYRIQTPQMERSGIGRYRKSTACGFGKAKCGEYIRRKNRYCKTETTSTPKRPLRTSTDMGWPAACRRKTRQEPAQLGDRSSLSGVCQRHAPFSILRS